MFECGAPWKRQVKASGGAIGQGWHDHANDLNNGQRKFEPAGKAYRRETIGWKPTCKHKDAGVAPCTILDPFNGAATTGVVALKNGRKYIGIDINPEYLEMSKRRLLSVETGVSIKDQKSGQMSLFGGSK